jgi:hypothetical protein
MYKTVSEEVLHIILKEANYTWSWLYILILLEEDSV